MTNNSYGDRINDFNPQIVEATKKLIGEPHSTIWKKSESYAMKSMRTWLSEVSKLCEIKKPLLKIDSEMYASGRYYADKNQIILPKVSVVTLLHEFAHALNHQKGLPNSEDNARAWSCSLFKNAAPKHYAKAVRKNLIFFH